MGLRRFFDDETIEFTYSCGRDLFKGLLVTLCAVIFKVIAIAALAKIEFPKWATWTIEQVHALGVVATITSTLYIFLGKLLARRER